MVVTGGEPREQGLRDKPPHKRVCLAVRRFAVQDRSLSYLATIPSEASSRSSKVTQAASSLQSRDV